MAKLYAKNIRCHDLRNQLPIFCLKNVLVISIHVIFLQTIYYNIYIITYNYNIKKTINHFGTHDKI